MGESSREGSGLTLAAVARAARVSVMTASRALRGTPECAPETRRRVLTAARRLGYRPNPLVSAYQAQVRRRGKNGGASIGWLNDFAERGFWHRAPGYWTGIWRGSRSRAEALGFGLEEIWVPLTGGEEAAASLIARAHRQVVAKGLSGLLVPPGRLPQCDLAEWPGLAVVCGALGRHLPDHPDANYRHHTVVADFYSNIVMACLELQRLGCERIGLHLPGYVDAQTQWRYRSGYLGWQWALPVQRRLPILSADYPLFGKCPEDFARWVRKHRPDALLCAKSETVGWLKDAGLRVPGDIRVAHLWLAEDVSGWGGIDPNLGAIGSAMVDILVGKLYRNERSAPLHPQLIQIPGRWVDGWTVGGPARTAARPVRRRSQHQPS